MRKALVFVAAFALVLIAGAAVAFMATPGGDLAADEPEAIEKPTTTSSTFHEENEEPSITEAPKEEPYQEEAPAEEEPKHPEEPPKEEEPVHEVDTDPPDLVILFPENGQHFTEKKIAFEGITEPGARVFAGKYEADVDQEGNWRIVLILSDGGNLARFTAADEAGNESTAEVQAYFDPPKEEAPKEYDFIAHQKYGECAEPLPYDKWYGSGEPGTEIWIESEYGGASTTIGEHGEWSLRVEFPESPCNKTIAVVLETDKGDRLVYEFYRICEQGGEGGNGK